MQRGSSAGLDEELRSDCCGGRRGTLIQRHLETAHSHGGNRGASAKALKLE